MSSAGGADMKLRRYIKEADMSDPRLDVDVTVEEGSPPETEEPEKTVETEKTVEKTVETEKTDPAQQHHGGN